ncbi:MAG: biotin--[acetyl-CoA-carboxylase] ligase [Acidobacteria bacterium]|nr:biotin--[acetyl-CoA-carboxylase] ligase [Acidobacteriota bacterium]
MISFAGGSLDPRRWRTLQNLVVVEAMSSSNDLAREIVEMYFAEEQELPPTVLIGEGQTAARGRRGRWTAEPGRGLYLTIVRRTGAGEPMSLIPIAVGRWVRDVLAEHAGLEASLKWPNDVYAGGRKLAGILAESRTQGEDTYVAVGLGLNALGTAGSVGIETATTVEQETGRAAPLAPLMQALLDRCDAELSSPGWEREVERWERVSLHRPGDRLTIRRDGEEVSGAYRGLTPEGFLRLETSAGETVCATGELARW